MVGHPQRRLTPRSRRGPTASHQARPPGEAYHPFGRAWRLAVEPASPRTLGSAKRAIQMHRCKIGLRPRPFIVLRQRSPALSGVCSLPKSLSPPQRTRSQSRRRHLLFSAGTWCYFLWQINQRAFNALRAALPKCLLGGAQRRCPLRVTTVVCHLPALVVHRLRLQLWHRPTTFAAQWPVAPNTVRALVRRRYLTLRSS